MAESEHRRISGHFEELPPERCEELLATTTVGRVAFAGERHIEILPVNYVYRDATILFRTSPFGALSALVEGVDGVAFEVDHHDDTDQSGWSVVVVGRVEAVADTTELTDLWAQVGPSPWAAGTRTLVLRLVPTSMSGRGVRRDRP